ncbi:hypothetical protein [Defluviitoga tunisiensis]|uniref:CBM20 domain-containing protein n=1 Tax=Defluviitoga tunisiensis TaxID=1006576 RepID=A0A0C7P2K8_DEFTU|nr:hypothetical protein [Defluviitoga tunisiensis]CEP78179.1 hypothetical protein DTL3_0872 [Defluviitoga tunisiensis]
MKKSLFYMLILLSIVFALTGCLPKTAGQEPPVPVVSFKAYLPENTPDDATIYIIGNYCNWDFGGAKTSEVKTDNGQKYAEFELQVAEFPLQYKYTVGPDWKYVEKDAEGNEIGDRVIESAPEEVVIDTVASWAAIPTPPSEEPTIVNIKAYLPENTPDGATIYIIGSYCGWEFDNAATSEVKVDTENKKYAEFELQATEFPLEYKYTVGPDWKYVEVKADGNDLDGNRKIDSAPEGVVIDTVASWAAIPTPPSEEPTIVNIKAYLPENTPDGATIYIIGSYCGWEFDNAATSEVKVDTENKKYAEFELQATEFPLEYKYTVGPGWDYEEAKADGTGLPTNRRIDFKPTADIQEVVLNWKGKELIDYTDLQKDITVTFIGHVPEGTEDDNGKIYVRGSFNNWGNDDGGTPLEKTEDGTYTCEVTAKSYTLLEFKFLRKDDWNYEENVGANRIAILTDDSTITCLVEGWKN